jgi:hypothetical protein
MDFYAPGTFGAQSGGRHIRVLDAYAQAREKARLAAESGQYDSVQAAQEAMSVSDFPTYLGSFQRHSFLERFEEVRGNYDQWTGSASVPDFETHTTSGFGRFPDMPQKPLNSEYRQVALRETPGPSIQLIEWGMAWAVTRQLILSDRLDRLNDLPTLASDSVARTISKRAVSVLEGNGNTYDGVALIHANHGNRTTTALTADAAGMEVLKTAILALENQTDSEGYKIVTPRNATYTLVVPTGLQFVAQALANREQLPFDATSGTSQLRVNEVAGRITPVVEPYLTDATNWYLFADPRGRNSAIRQITLNGNTTPFIGLRDPGVRALLGGDDPYSFDFDEVEWKARHDFDFVLWEWRGVYGGVVAG